MNPGHAKNITIRLATPDAIGSGFYLAAYALIITSEHLVHGYSEIVVEGRDIPRQMAKVVYTDDKIDLAILQTDAALTVPEAPVLTTCEEEQPVFSYAYPFTEGEMSCEGYIDDENYDFHGHPHIMHDALLSNAANGSGLFAVTGELLGMNSFISWKGRAVGMALPIENIVAAVVSYRDSNYAKATRCSECNAIVNVENVRQCSKCENFLDLPIDGKEYSPSGVALTVEHILSSMGYTLDLARIGHDHWEVTRGSAAVNITYYEKNGLIIGDAYMCKLPDRPNTELYEFLLRQNSEMENLTFSVKGDDIILSLLIYDRYLNEQTGTELLTNLLEKADFFDNILVEQYKCLWTSSRKLL